ncbi:MAG: hypothetical protein ABIP16_04570 [Thermomonas sp.]
MLRKMLLTMLATAAMAGCATDYNYRGGNGDYYYGQPRVEYRDIGPGGYYGGFGLGYGYGSYGSGSYGYGPTYFYDRFGRLVYGYPGSYYGSAYYGRNGWYGPRPHHEHGDHNDHDDHNNHDHDGDDTAGNNHDRPAPWRDLGGLQQRDEDGNLQRRMRQSRPALYSPAPYSQAPIRQQSSARSAPVIRQRSEPGSFMGGVAQPLGKRNPPPEE